MQELQLLQGSDGQRLQILERVAAEWEMLAIQIGFEPSKISILQRDYAENAYGACCRVFSEWLTQDSPTWISLYDVLLHTNYENVADQMKALL